MSMAILRAALAFFGEKMVTFLEILTTDIVYYGSDNPGVEPGPIWKAIGIIYDAILAMGITVAGVLIWFGLLSSTSRYAELKKATVWGQFLVEIVITNAVLYYGKTLLLYAVQIGQGMARKAMEVSGILQIDTITHSHWFWFSDATETEETIDLGISQSVSPGLSNAVEDLSLSKGILLFIVVLIGAVFIVVATLGVLLTVYGRLFNLYVMIAISPLPIATAIGKPTRFVFFNFIKSFLAVVLEALVIVLVLFVFTNFVKTQPDMNNYSDYVSPQKYTAAFIPGGLSDLTSWSDDDLEGFLEKAREDYPEGYVIDVLRGVNEPIKIPDSVKELKNNYRRYKKMQDDLGGSVFSYIAEMAFLFLMLFGMLKGTDKLVHRIFGI